MGATHTTAAKSTTPMTQRQVRGDSVPEIRERMFDLFCTSKPAGTGLGLAISAHIVTQHGGQIEVESTAVQGSTFRPLLPMPPRA